MSVRISSKFNRSQMCDIVHEPAWRLLATFKELPDSLFGHKTYLSDIEQLFPLNAQDILVRH